MRSYGLIKPDYRLAQYSLSLFDTDETAIEVGEKKFISKGQYSKIYSVSLR